MSVPAEAADVGLHAPRAETRGQLIAAAVLIVVGVMLRIWALDLGWFGVDQARDVATALDIVHGVDAPTVGPTMRRVVRLGALYYYVWASPYLVWRDPMAGYWFAALLGVVAMLLLWRLARRLWGAAAGLVVLAVVAAHPVWIIDGRIAWAPAALPLVGASILWLVLATPGAALSPRRAVAIGAVLGLAIQLHLAMGAWVAAVALVVLGEPTRWRTARWALGGGLVTGWPALWAVVAAPMGEGGVTALATRGAPPAIGHRLAVAFALPWRVPAAFAQWSEHATTTVPVTVAAAVLGAATLLGCVRLVLRHRDGRVPRMVLATVGVGGVLVVGLPGDVWYYYLDAVLPAAALAAGALGIPLTVGARWARLVPGVLIVAALVLALHLGIWLDQVAAHGYMSVDPTGLTLDGRPGNDAPAPGRLLTVRVKRDVAVMLARSGLGFESLWGRLHGPAVGDATGDNGFWLRWAVTDRPAAAAAPAADGRHLALWYRDAPVVSALARAARAADVEIVEVGPLAVVRYPPAIDYASCRTSGAPIAVPIRILPHPKRYGDGAPPRPAALPRVVECRLGAGAGSTRVVAALDGPGSVRVRAGADEAPAGPTSALCIARGTRAVTFTIEIEPSADGPAALDLYEVPLGVGCNPETAGAEIAAVFPGML